MRYRPAYLPLYVRDFLTDPNVMMMRWIDQAIYLRMLMASWELGPLPDDDEMVFRLIQGDHLASSLEGYGVDCGRGGFAFGGREGHQFDIHAAIRGVLETCWEMSGDEWVNPRLEVERQHALETMSKNSGRTAAGWKTRWANAEQVLNNCSAMQSQDQDQDQKKKKRTPPPPSGVPPSKKAKKPLWTGTLPEPLRRSDFELAWMGWLAYRSEEIRKPVTQRSGDMALRELEALGAERAIAAINHTIAKGWQGIREAEPGRNGQAVATVAKPKVCAKCGTSKWSSLTRTELGEVCTTCYRGK